MRRVRLSSLVLLGMVVLLALMPASAAWAKKPDKVTLELSWDEPFWDCGEFEIYEKADVRLVVMEFYDKDENVTRHVEHWNLDGGLYREDAPESYLPYVPAHEKAIFNDAGEVVIVGLFVKVIIPGEGPIFHDAGRVELDSDGILTFSAGRHDYFEGNDDALCAAFQP